MQRASSSQFVILKRTVLAASLVLAGAAGAAAAEKPKRGGTLRIGHSFEVQGFDPFTIAVPNRATASAGSLMWERPYRPDGKGGWEPVSASYFTTADDSRSVVWHFDKTAKFSTGEPYTAHVVAAHWQRMMDPARNKSFAQYISMIKEIKARDDWTLEVHYKYPFAPASTQGRINSYLSQAMPPAHIAKAGEDLNRQPIGPGPYMIESWKQASTITFVRNPHFGSPERQYLDKIIFKQIPNAEARLNALKAGDIDLVIGLVEKDIEKIKDDKRFNVVSFPSTGGSVIYINTSKPAVSDARVRRALAHAIDRKTYNKIFYKGLRRMATDVWGPSSSWHCKDTGYPGYDLAKAKALLKDYGKPVKITMTTSTTPLGLLAAQVLQSMWKKAGIEVDFRQVQVGPQYIGEVVKGNYEMAFWRIADLSDPDTQVYKPFHSSSRGNFTHTKNAEIDKALDKGRRSMDEATRKQAYCEFSRAMSKHMSMIFNGQSTYHVVARKGVMNLPDLNQGYFRAAEVWLKN